MMAARGVEMTREGEALRHRGRKMTRAAEELCVRFARRIVTVRRDVHDLPMLSHAGRPFLNGWGRMLDKMTERWDDCASGDFNWDIGWGPGADGNPFVRSMRLVTVPLVHIVLICEQPPDMLPAIARIVMVNRMPGTIFFDCTPDLVGTGFEALLWFLVGGAEESAGAGVITGGREGLGHPSMLPHMVAVSVGAAIAQHSAEVLCSRDSSEWPDDWRMSRVINPGTGRMRYYERTT